VLSLDDNLMLALGRNPLAQPHSLEMFEIRGFSSIKEAVSNSSRVFAMPEMLEAILLLVDVRTVLISCQRVYKLWHFVIARSPALQRHLFFLPDQTSSSPPFMPNPLSAEHRMLVSI